MIIEQIKCDVCGKLKQDVNHWWISWSKIQPHGSPYLCIDTFEDGAVADDLKHLCGQECVIKTLSEWMHVRTEG